jgi:hypothetical protein
MLPWSKLVDMFCKHSVCWLCSKPSKPSNFEKVQIHFATSFNHYCSWRSTIWSLEADNFGIEYANQNE